MAASLVVALPDLTNEELDEVALAVATEQARRLAEATAEHAEEPEEIEQVYVTAYGRCWHRDRNCMHLRHSRTVRTVPCPETMRGCRTCSPTED